jgi:hypothetical protein
MLKINKKPCFLRRCHNVVLTIGILLFTTYGHAIEINTFIQSGNDDVEERESGRISSTSSDLEMVDDSDIQTIGLRFTNVNIPQGALITTAHIQFTADETDSEVTQLNIYGELSDNASAFSSTTGDVTARQRSSSSVFWNVPIWDTTKERGLKQQTPELKTILQEIVNQGGWSANNSMVFIINGSGKRVADSYEGGVDRAPQLYVSYEVGDTVIDNNSTDSNTTIDDINSSEETNSGVLMVLDTAVSDDDDDAEELSNGDISTGSSDLELVYDGANQTVGMRFVNLGIPQGATITNAYLKFTTDERDSEVTELNIYAEKSSNPAFYENIGFNISSRTKTTAFVRWSVPEWAITLESAEKQTTPNLKALVQEVIDLDTWTANSNMAFMITGTGKRVADSHEGGSERAPKLHIEYRIGGVETNTTDTNTTDEITDNNGTDNNTTDGQIDNNTTDGGVDNNTTDGGGTDNNATNGGSDSDYIGAITFTEDVTANQDNPDRGLFYGEYYLNEDAGYDVFQGVKNKGYLLAYAVIDMNDYRGSMTLPQSLFDNLTKNFNDAETAGVKMILRFKYRVDRDSSLVDPSIEMIEAHMDQLKPFLLQHQDIISVVQAGTIGAWGEWNNFTGDFAESDPDFKNNRKRVVDKLAELFPKKYIQLRTPMHKELIYGGSINYSDIASDAKITQDMDFESNILSRLSHHNDCIFANENDYGTYGANDIQFWKDYVANDSKYAPVGGVSCGEMEEQYKTCESALSTFKGLEYSFIMDNPSSHRVALHDQWKTEGCYSEIVNNLGYRLVATGLDVEVNEVSNHLDINFSVENRGFAAPHVPVKVSYVLKSTSGEYSFAQSNVDIRKFASKSTNRIDANLDLSSVSTGEYCLYLQLGEGFSAIRLSNGQNSEGTEIWNATSKNNQLVCGIAISNDNPVDSNNTDVGEDTNSTEEGTDTNTMDGGDNGTTPTTSQKLGTLIPLYVYPDFHKSDSEWQRVIDNKLANPEAEIIVIANPSSGHFSAVDTLYAQAIQKTVEANITVVGYVYTQYGARDINVVKADIDNWTRFYKDLGVTGIFFDETEGRESKGKRSYYKALTDYIKEQGYEISILNPGITADQTFVDNYTADIIVSFESGYSEYLQDFKTGDVGKTVESELTSTALMIHDIDTLAHLQQVIADAPTDGFDYVYVTTGDSGWDDLGSDFEAHIIEMLKYDRDPVPDNGVDDNTTDSGTDNNTTDTGVDSNTTDAGTDDNTTTGEDNNTTNDSGNIENNQTIISAIIEQSISSGSDDVEESESGSMSLSSSDLELVQDGSTQTVGLRFTNLDIPIGATITSAYIQFTTDETRGVETTLLDIYAQKVSNATLFTTATANVSSRIKTSASVNWNVPLWEVVDERGEKQKTPELKTLIQEVIDLNGWQRGNAMVFIIQGVGRRVADAYEGGVQKAPQLHIEYQVSSNSEEANVGSSSNTITYIEDSSVNVLNPDRGLYLADYILTEETDYDIFQEVKDRGYSMAFAPINLYDYGSTATLPDSLLNTIEGHLIEAENLGIKLILRIKYRPNASSSYVDPSLNTILGHMEQLKPLLRNHKDIISVIQAGTIGAWGEWNTLTGEFDSDTDANYKDNMRAVIAKLVEIFPEKYIQIRTPMYKELLYGTAVNYKDEGTTGQITPSLAFGEDIRAKIGHHNDCLLVDDTNYGTYGSNIDFWKNYVANDSKYTPVGGETCGIDQPELTDCSYAVPELRHLQYSYLNDVYHEDVINKWKSQGCYTEIKENLGYRLVAKDFSFDSNNTENRLDVTVNIENKGFSAPYVQADVAFVLKNEYNSYTFTQANVDIRTFEPERTTTIESAIDTLGVEEGNYCLYMKMGEAFSAIRFSNSQNSNGVTVWDDTLKMNLLGCGIQLP